MHAVGPRGARRRRARAAVRARPSTPTGSTRTRPTRRSERGLGQHGAPTDPGGRRGAAPQRAAPAGVVQPPCSRVVAAATPRVRARSSPSAAGATTSPSSGRSASSGGRCARRCFVQALTLVLPGTLLGILGGRRRSAAWPGRPPRTGMGAPEVQVTPDRRGRRRGGRRAPARPVASRSRPASPRDCQPARSCGTEYARSLDAPSSATRARRWRRAPPGSSTSGRGSAAPARARGAPPW